MNCKMLHFSLCAAGALLISASAFAQQDASSKTQPIPSAVKDAGVFHVATGTWTRASKDPIANLGPDVLYDNTCSVGFFSGLSTGETYVDGGRLPSTTSPGPPIFSVTGTADTYVINGFQSAYCSISEPRVDFAWAWFECYAVCSDATVLTPDMALGANVPGDPTAGSGTCWVITFDLENTTFAFTLSADCSGTYGGSSALDGFGWSILNTTPSANATVGPIIAGDPLGIRYGGPLGTGCPIGDGTVWQPGIGVGTGIGADDAWESDIGGAPNACYFFGGYFGGNLFSSFHHELYGVAGGDNSIGTQECLCDAASAPCGNPYPTGGCLNSRSLGAILTGQGTDILVNDDLVLYVTQARPNRTIMWLQGSAPVVVPFRDGVLCVGGTTVRLYPDTSDAAGDNDTTDAPAGGIVAQSASKGYVIPPASHWYQVWYRDGGGPCGTGSNLSNTLRIDWQ